MRRLCNLHSIGVICWCVVWTGCSADLDEQINQLALGGDARDTAKQELLLAKEQAIEPLLTAVEAPHLAGARREVVKVLFSMMTRVEDQRISAALIKCLQTDADPQVRAFVAQRMGMFKHKAAVPTLFKSLEDESSDVRHQAIMALGELSARLDSSQLATLADGARRLSSEGMTAI